MTLPAELPTRIRIVLARMPRLLRDLLRDALERHPRVDVEEDQGHDDIGAIVARTRADGVILGALGDGDATARDEIVRALFQSPRTRILLVSERGASARLHELTPTHRSVSDVTPAGLGAAIHSRLAPVERGTD